MDSIDRILDFKIIKQYDQAVSKFILSKSSPNSIDIEWEYFDPNFGFNFQILFVGKEDPNFLLEGKLLGVSSFSKVKQRQKGNFWILIIIDGLILIPILYLSIELYKRRNDTRIISTSGILVFMIFIFFFAYLFVTDFILPVDPPF